MLEFPNPTWGQAVAFILFGLGALTYAKHPEGIIEFQTTASVNRILALGSIDAVAKAPTRPPPGIPPRHGATPAGATAATTDRSHGLGPETSDDLHLCFEADQVTKRFAGILALDHVTLTVDRGELVALDRPQRRRQDHLLQLPARRAHAPTSGRMMFDGHDLPGLAVHRRARPRPRPHVPATSSCSSA